MLLTASIAYFVTVSKHVLSSAPFQGWVFEGGASRTPQTNLQSAFFASSIPPKRVFMKNLPLKVSEEGLIEFRNQTQPIQGELWCNQFDHIGVFSDQGG